MPAGGQSTSLLLPALTSGDQCFVNGKLLHTEGTVKDAGAPRYSMPTAIELPPTDSQHPQAYLVALRVWFDPQLDGSSEGGPSENSAQVASVGDTAAVHSKLLDFFALQRQKRIVRFDLALLFWLASLVCFPLYLMQRSNREYLWYSIAAATFGADLAIYFDQLTHGWRISTFLFTDSLLNVGTSVGLIIFFSYLLRAKRNWLITLVLVVSIFGAFAGWFQYLGWISISLSNTLAALAGCLFSAFVISLVARRASQRVLDAMLLVLPVSIDFGLLFVDSLGSVFPAAAQPVDALADAALFTYPFQVRLRDVTAPLCCLPWCLCC